MFAKVVEFGSFTAAARQLQMSVSSISQTVSKLEDELQVKLLNRSTRSIGLTEAGRIYSRAAVVCFMKCRFHEQLYAFNNTPSGRYALAVLQLWHKCSRRADSQNAERIPRFERRSRSTNPAPT
ncbi:LysR family transcriptional regulator [Escherichia coli]